jgi:hypothetical protein
MNLFIRNADRILFLASKDLTNRQLIAEFLFLRNHESGASLCDSTITVQLRQALLYYRTYLIVPVRYLALYNNIERGRAIFGPNEPKLKSACMLSQFSCPKF